MIQCQIQMTGLWPITCLDIQVSQSSEICKPDVGDLVQLAAPRHHRWSKYDAVSTRVLFPAKLEPPTA